MDPINLRPRKSVLNRCSALLLTQKCLTAPSYVSTKATFLVTTVSIPVFANHFYPALDISRGNIQISWDSLPVHGSSLSLDKHLKHWRPMAGRQSSQLFFDENLRACCRRFAASCAHQRKNGQWLARRVKTAVIKSGRGCRMILCPAAQHKIKRGLSVGRLVNGGS